MLEPSPSNYQLGPVRNLAEHVKIGYYSGGPQDHFGAPLLLRASGRASEGQTEIVMERHVVLSYTPCGAWIDTWDGKRFVNLRAGKQWASTTEAEAIDQLYYRKRTQVRILSARLDEAREVLAAMEEHLGKKAPPARRYTSEWEY